MAYHKEKNINITAYSPLGNAYEGKKPVVQYDVIVEIAKKHDATPAQVLISWGALGGHTIIPKSVTPDRIESNFKSLDVKLDEDDIKKIEQLGKYNYVRFNVPFEYKPQWDINVFGEPQEKAAKADVQFGV